jgi:hypothetical protein
MGVDAKLTKTWFENMDQSRETEIVVPQNWDRRVSLCETDCHLSRGEKTSDCFSEVHSDRNRSVNEAKNPHVPSMHLNILHHLENLLYPQTANEGSQVENNGIWPLIYISASVLIHDMGCVGSGFLMNSDEFE